MATGGEIPTPTEMSIVRNADGIVKVVFCTYTLVSVVFAFLSARLLTLIPRQTSRSKPILQQYLGSSQQQPGNNYLGTMDLRDHYQWGTFMLARHRFKMLTRPSPKISPLANTMTGVSSRFLYQRQYQFTKPPMVLASVKDGVLYMPISQVSTNNLDRKDGITNQQPRRYRLAPMLATTCPALLSSEPS